MSDAIKATGSFVSEVTNAQSAQFLLSIIVTITLAVMLILGKEIPDFLLYAWFAMIGIYMEIPSKVRPSGQ